MRQFIKRALQKLDEFDMEKGRNFILTASHEIDRLETVIDSLPRGILVCDNAHKLILANKSARIFLSIISYEQGREFVWSVIPEMEVADFLSHTLIAADKAEEREFSVEVNGTLKLLSVSVVPLVHNRHVTGAMVLVDDITERRAKEARMRRAESLASLTTLAAGVAHEIKNPLGSLSIHVQLIQKALETQKKLCAELFAEQGSSCDPSNNFPRIDKYLNVINEEMERLNGIVADFLFAVRPMNVQLRRGNINALIENLIEFLSFELVHAKVNCTLNLMQDVPLVNFDERLMKQAILNLIKNAIAAMSNGGTLIITTEAAERDLIISIADSGSGITAENISKIFEPYFTTKDSGSGLGLTVVFKIVREHSGEITVRSKEGEGSVFIITLPIPQVTQRLIAAQPDSAADETGGRE
ncbi:MAG: PAS domain-containing sensor histidine kinase [Treponema sp.]|jgi:signal transduction histidine kinase|nr:PAS domain-containing sensor histidine kinase [Treponema sp.]